MVAACDSLLRIVDLDSEQTPALPQVLDCPTRGRSGKSRVVRIDVRPGVKQQTHNLSIASLRRIVKRSGALDISGGDRFRPALEYLSHFVSIACAHSCE